MIGGKLACRHVELAKRSINETDKLRVEKNAVVGGGSAYMVFDQLRIQFSGWGREEQGVRGKRGRSPEN